MVALWIVLGNVAVPEARRSTPEAAVTPVAPGNAGGGRCVSSGVNAPRRLLILSLLALAIAACGSDETTTSSGPTTVPATDARVDPETADPTSPDTDDAAGGTSEPAELETVSGRVVRVDRDGPSVEIVEARIVTGDEATAAARADGEIGPEEEWELDFYVVEGERRWLDLDPNASVAVYDCTQACEHVAGTLEHVLSGPPYGGSNAIWTFELLDGRAVGAGEVYLP